MAVVIFKKVKNGKPIKKLVIKPKGPPPISWISKCGLYVGSVLLDAKGENKGVIVKSCDPLLDTVVVQDIDTQGKYGLRTMEAHQCAMVDYYGVSAPYEGWVLRVVEGRAAAAKK